MRFILILFVFPLPNLPLEGTDGLFGGDQQVRMVLSEDCHDTQTEGAGVGPGKVRLFVL